MLHGLHFHVVGTSSGKHGSSLVASDSLGVSHSEHVSGSSSSVHLGFGVFSGTSSGSKESSSDGSGGSGSSVFEVVSASSGSVC